MKTTHTILIPALLKILGILFWISPSVAGKTPLVITVTFEPN